MPALQTALFDGFTGFSVRYCRGAFVPAQRRALRPRGPQPGEIAPEADRGGRRWYPLWAKDTRHQLLVFSEPGSARDSALAWTAQRADVIRPLVVTAQALPIDSNVVPDPTGALHRRYAATSSGGLCLVRPDGYIAARSNIGDVAPLAAYVDTFLERAGAPHV